MKIDIHQEITDTIIQAIENGTAPWRCPWSGGGAGFPRRATGEYYSGINVLLLWCEAEDKGYSADHWMTFKQAKKLGACVRKGEKSTKIVFYSTFERQVDGQAEFETIPFLKSYRVFNADQIDGLPEKFKAIPAHSDTAPIERLEEFFAATGADICQGGTQAFYRPSTDQIQMPAITQFENAESFYQILAHEAIHWTGAVHRLDRLKTDRSIDEYAFEELIAEIGSCFVGARIGFEPSIERSAAYVENWLNALKHDKKFIFKAASKAQKACDYLTDLAPHNQPAAHVPAPVAVNAPAQLNFAL